MTRAEVNERDRERVTKHKVDTSRGERDQEKGTKFEVDMSRGRQDLNKTEAVRSERH